MRTRWMLASGCRHDRWRRAGAGARVRSSIPRPIWSPIATTIGPVGEVRDGQNFCDGFIAGSGLLYLELVAAKKMKQIACADPIPTLAAGARQPSSAWAAENPEHMASKPIDGFWRAMAATYPCPK